MKNIKKLVAVVVMAGMLGTAGTAFALARTPADVAAGLTGKTIEELYSERAEGKTYGAIANDADKLEEFRQEMLKQKKVMLDQLVKDGELTQEQADEIYNTIENRQAACDGTGSAAIGRRNGACFGQGNSGNGQGVGRGANMRKSGRIGRGLGINR